jgi:DNA-binding NarL/FixJ family response regulator
VITNGQRADVESAGDVSHSKLMELIRGARHEVLSTSVGVPPHVGARVVEAVLSGTCAPQVQVRILWSSCDEDHQCRIGDVVRRRVRVKVAEDLVHESLLIDRRLAVVPADAHHSTGVLLAVTTPSLVGAMVEWFTQRWATAVHWSVLRGRPDEFERSVLRALVAGMTDDMAAGRLGVSARTVRRYVNMLMDRVGARSRFELGFRAAEFGWVDIDPPADDRTGGKIRNRSGPPARCGCQGSSS